MRSFHGSPAWELRAVASARAPVTSRGAASTRFRDVAGEGRGLRLPASLNRGAIFESVLSLFKGLGRLFRFSVTANVVMPANAGIHGGERRNWRSGARACR